MDLWVQKGEQIPRESSALKEYYGRYLAQVRGLKESTVKHYYDALNNISRRLREKKLVKRDIYEITNLDYLGYVKDVLFEDPAFREADERGRRMYSAGLNNYLRFASGTDFGLLEKGLSKLDIPLAPEEPEVVEKKIWKRSDILRVQVIADAQYRCEMDERHKSFIAQSTGEPYMEGHHIIPMSLQGEFRYSLDVYANILCLCPLCHRMIHYGLRTEREKMLHQIYENRSHRLALSGFDLSRGEFTKRILEEE